MMMSPQSYLMSFQDKSYESCIKERNRLIRSIRSFEKRTPDVQDYMRNPSPDVVYQCELEYLGKLCELISEKYRSLQEEDE